MQARCPSCQTLFTTDRLGLQFCTACGRQVSVAAQASEPSEPTPPGRVPTPWERRQELGWVVAYIQTWKRAVFSPELFWRSVRADGPWIDALLYGWITISLSVILSLPLHLLTSALSMGKGAAARTHDYAALPRLFRQVLSLADTSPGVAGILFGLIGGIFFVPLGIFLGAAILHSSCLLFGEGKRGFWTTFRIVAYGASPNLFSFIPCAGLVTGMYVMVQEVLGLRYLGEMKTEKAVAIVCVPLILGCCCVGGILAAVGGTMFGLGTR